MATVFLSSVYKNWNWLTETVFGVFELHSHKYPVITACLVEQIINSIDIKPHDNLEQTCLLGKHMGKDATST